MIPALCILQARLASTRLPEKMLRTLNGESLIARGWRMACQTFGPDHCVVAIPAADGESQLGFHLRTIGARVFLHAGKEEDVLGRFYACAHHFRWNPASVIVRWTPDDPWKDPATCQAVVAGERHPVELGGEAFTLAQLDFAYHKISDKDTEAREHLTLALYPFLPPPPPDDGLPWTIDTEADYAAVRSLILDGVETAEQRLARGRVGA